MKLAAGLFHHLVLVALLLAAGAVAPASAGGSWKLLQSSVGVSGMHMQLLHNDRVILFDRTNFGPSNLTFPPGHPCRVNTQDVVSKGAPDCTAHSVEYNVSTNTFRALSVVTDTWCSSGYVDADGALVQNGGWRDGTRKVRVMPACADASCDWAEQPDTAGLAAGRWYATNQRLPDGRAIVIGGEKQATYEFLPKSSPGSPAVALPLQFLNQTNSLYPFVHLNTDGNLFIFATNRAILFDYKTGSIVKTYPPLGNAGELRNNPYAGSSVLLPLKPGSNETEVLVCGGTLGAVKTGQFPPALTSCGRIKVNDQEPSWVVEQMPSPRVMGDMILLPNGEVAIINGAKDGVGGWESAKTPSTTPVIYKPDAPLGSRFQEQAPAPRPRMYHSSAVLLRDGRVLVGGSNPHHYYNFTNNNSSPNFFPTDLSLEAFSPDYLDGANNNARPIIIDPSPKDAPESVTYGQNLTLEFYVPTGDLVTSVTMMAPSFTTHSFAQNQRQLFLQVDSVTPVQAFQGGSGQQTSFFGIWEASVVMPATPVLAPPGYYMLFVVNGRIPSSQGLWVHIK